MKRTLLMMMAATSCSFAVAQTLLTSGVIVPNNNKGTLLLPSATTKPVDNTTDNKTIIAQPLPKGTYFTPKGAILILPNRNARNTGGVAQQNTTLPANNGGLGSLADASLTSNNSTLNNTAPANNNSFLPPLSLGSPVVTQPTVTTNNNIVNQNLPSLTSLTAPVTTAANNAMQSAVNAANNYNQQLPALTNLPTTNYSAPTTNVISGAYTTSKFNNAANNVITTANNTVANNNTIMPPLASIGTVAPKANQQQQQYAMPPLASIVADRPNNANQQNMGMPALAPIEGQGVAGNNQNTMPALAPIEGSNTGGSNMQELAPIKSNGLKGFALPKGTILNAKTGTSYTVKPLPATEANKTEDEPAYKPGAGGGMGMPALAPIEEAPVVVKEAMPALAAIEKTVEKQEDVMPALAPIAEAKQPVAYQGKNMQQPQQKVVYQSAAPTAKNPCIHIDGSYCPCCVQKPAAKKWTPKKKWTAKKWTPKKPANIVYVHQPVVQPQQPARATQRVVYVPNQPKAQPQQTQPQQPVKQSQERVVYTDYTKAYYKEPEKPNCNCNQTGAGNAANNPQKYYNPAKYAGINSGPTSGDYPVTSVATTNEPLKYKFYLTPRGKYSVEIYNPAFSAFLSQDGSLQDYRLNGDASAEKPKLNYFSKPESLAGTPITYNYNRKVNQIGGVKLDYDFEGFIKNINGTPVLYTSRSSLASVNGIRVQYDGNGNVTGVDSNDGTVQYTGN